MRNTEEKKVIEVHSSLNPASMSAETRRRNRKIVTMVIN